jgi:hypothetical protein
MEKVISKTEQFCLDIVNLPVNRHRPLANLVMSLCGCTTAKSVVELSESAFFHYHYSNLSKILNDIARDGSESSQSVELDRLIRTLLVPYLPPIRTELGVSFYGFSTDVTKLLKAHSPTLEGRGYVPIANNVIASNQSIGVGYRVSMTHLNALEQGADGWCPPMVVQRLSVQDDAIDVGVAQIRSLLTDTTLPFSTALCIEKADMGYAHASFLSPLYALESLVCLVRLRPSSKVWQQASTSSEQTPDSINSVKIQGAPAIYGKKWYLTDTSQDKIYTKKGETYTVWQDSIMDLPASDTFEIVSTLKNGRQIIIVLTRWNDLLKRTKQGHSMKDKPLDVVRVLVIDAKTGDKVFDRPLFIAVSGQRKQEIPTPLVQTQYRERSDVEGVYRFGKHNMFLDKLQTPDVKHLDNWLKVWMLSVWLLFTARQQTPLTVKVWEKYLPINKVKAEQTNPVLTMPQVRKGINTLFATFDKTPFLPKKYKKGKGRQKGQKQPKRKRFTVTKKVKKITINKLKCQKNE